MSARMSHPSPDTAAPIPISNFYKLKRDKTIETIRELEKEMKEMKELHRKIEQSRREWQERVKDLERKQARILLRHRPVKKGSQKRFKIKNLLRNGESLQSLLEQADMGQVTLGGGEYRQVTTLSEVNQGSGRSIFFASEDSSVPYLIIICNEYFITEYQLVSVNIKNLPIELYLKLSEAILRAHRFGIVLGPDLNINNIKWDVSRDPAGLPVVTLKNLPPPSVPGDPPRPPPKWSIPIPGLPDSSGATKESDIYCTPTILSQIIFKIEDSLKEALKNRDELKEIESSSIPARTVHVTDPGQMPSACMQNSGLLAIAKKCLSSNPAARPTAEHLVEKLRILVRRAACRDVARFIGGSLISAVRGNIFRSP